MPLTPGTRLGSYEIIAALGAGGMGEVYRAQDTRLGREVALKLILEAFLADRERLARFEREARTLAAVNHPNIATLYGLEEAEGRHFLVMELVPGQTLAELITLGHAEAEGVSSRLRDRASAAERGDRAPRGLKIDDALPIALQIAEALEAAHERGIVHRDLKPANIKITAEGKVKVLDFGLATTIPGSKDPGLHSDLANSPTLTVSGTLAGTILGTASYMSPEQARGMAADHRSDIFSFGVVLFEMLTGRQPFQGDTVSDVLASVLARDPDLAALPPRLPPRLSELVARCLEKQPKRRWQAIGDIRHELEVIAGQPASAIGSAASPSTTEAPAGSAPGRPLWRRALPIAAAVLVTAGITIAAATLMRPAPASAPVTRFIIPYAEGLQLTVRPGIAISPDGSRVVYVLNRKLYVRELGAFEGRALTPGAGAAGGAPLSPVFSPDGTAIAYFDNVDMAIKVVTTTGVTSTACKMTEMPAGLSWSGDYIYIAATPGIQRVVATGGSPELMIKTDPEDAITRPQLLDDGRLLYSLATRDPAVLDRWVNSRIVVQRPGDPQPTVIVDKGSDPRYLRSGHLVYVYGGVLHARSFDPARMIVGPQTPMVEGVFRSAGTIGAGLWWYGVSENGTLVFQPGAVGAMGEQQLAIALFTRDGKIEPTTIRPGPYWHPRMSPNGQRMAFGVDDGRDISLWVSDIAAGTLPTRITFGGRDRYPVWSHDSQRLIFQSNRDGAYSLYSQAADGSDSATRLTTTAGKDVEHAPQSVSPDGSALLFDETKGGVTVLKSYAFKDKSASPFGNVQSLVPTGAVFSRNGRWVAYTIRRARQSLAMIEVQPYPATGAKSQVSLTSEDGHHPIWSWDGKELFYTPGPGALFNSVTVNTTGTAFSFGPGQAFARKFANMAPSAERPYDITRDAKGDAVILGLASNTADPTKEQTIELRVVVNWVEELKARVK